MKTKLMIAALIVIGGGLGCAGTAFANACYTQGEWTSQNITNYGGGPLFVEYGQPPQSEQNTPSKSVKLVCQSGLNGGGSGVKNIKRKWIMSEWMVYASPTASASNNYCEHNDPAQCVIDYATNTGETLPSNTGSCADYDKWTRSSDDNYTCTYNSYIYTCAGKTLTLGAGGGNIAPTILSTSIGKKPMSCAENVPSGF